MKRDDIGFIAFLVAVILLAFLGFYRDATNRRDTAERLRFMAENGYQQKWEPNSQQLIWTKEVK